MWHPRCPTHAHQVAQLVSSAQSQLKSGDYAGAVKTVDTGMRLDAGNKDLQAVLDRAKPKFEAAERSRRSGLSSTELLKEKGDDFYRKASFEVCVFEGVCFLNHESNFCRLFDRL